MWRPSARLPCVQAYGHVDEDGKLNLLPLPLPLPLPERSVRSFCAAQAYGQVDEDGTRFLLSDFLGNLHLLLLLREDGGGSGSSGGGGGGVAALKLEPLGRTPVASTISYLDSGVVFVGSSFGDSQLIRCVRVQIPVCWTASSGARQHLVGRDSIRWGCGMAGDWARLFRSGQGPAAATAALVGCRQGCAWRRMWCSMASAQLPPQRPGAAYWPSPPMAGASTRWLALSHNACRDCGMHVPDAGCTARRPAPPRPAPQLRLCACAPPLLQPLQAARHAARPRPARQLH